MKSQLLHHAEKAVDAAGKPALDALAPPVCPLSHDEIAQPGALGPAGWTAVQFIDAPFCACCGIPFAAEYGAKVECPSCIAASPDFERARAAVVYDDASHNLIVGFKHSDRTELAPLFAQWMARAGRALINSTSVLAPVPPASAPAGSAAL